MTDGPGTAPPDLPATGTRHPLLLPSLVIGVGAVALLVRLLALRDHEAANPLFAAGPILDERIYVDGAGRIAAGAPPTEGDLLLSRVWPRLLAALGATTRHDAALVNAWIGAAVAACAAVFALRIAGTAAALAAGGLAALCGGLVFTDVTAQTEPLLGLATLAAAGTLALAAAAGRTDVSGRTLALAAAGGAACAGAAWIRGTSALLLLGALPLLRGPGRARRGAAVAAGFAAVVALGVALGGSLPRGGALNAWLGNNAFARETRSYGTDEFTLTPDEQAAQVAALRAGGRSFADRALAEAAQAPGAAAAHLGVKTVLVFSRDEIPNIHDPLAEQSFSRWTDAFAVRVWPLFAFAAAAWFAARRVLPATDALGLALAGHLLGLVLVFPLSRYRMPAVPAACVLVGVLLHVAAARSIDRMRALRACAVGCGIAALAFAATWLRPPARPESWTNLGVASRAKDPEASEAYLRRAVGEDPSYAPALTLLGDALLDRRRNDAALSHFTSADTPAARSRWPGVWRDARMGRSRALSNLGRHEDAMRLHDEARSVLPSDAGLAADGVLLALAKGDRGDAERRLAAARAVDPAHPAVRAAADALR